ncbi:MAG: cache domain-containing protein [Motilibacteraceae bacterium]
MLTGRGGEGGVLVDADAAAVLVQQVLALAAQVFAGVDALRLATVDAFTGALPARPDRAGLAGLEPLARLALTTPDELVVGAGFVAAPGALADAEHWLEWWTRGDVVDGAVRVERLAVVTDPAAPDFRDWTTLPWYSVPEQTGQQHVTGPYVDYLCTDDYTLTFTMPVLAAGRFVGVTGADVYARTVERRLSEALREVPEPAAIVNAQGRVVAGNEDAPVTGDLLRAVAAAWSGTAPEGGLRLHRCGDLPLAVAVGV